MIRRRKKRKTVTEELSLFGPEQWKETVDMEPETESTSESIPSDTCASSAVNQLLDDMTWAIGYIRLLDMDTTRMLAMETSMIVQSNLQPDNLYILNTLSGERLNGQKLAVLCYASFMRAFPSMIGHLNLQYYDIYQAALVR